MAFDKKEYQRNYMRNRRAKSNGKSQSNAKDNVVEMPRYRAAPPGMALEMAMKRFKSLRGLKVQTVPLSLPEPPPGVVPKTKAKEMSLAMDSSIVEQNTWVNAQFAGNMFGMVAREGLLFLGYAYLSELAQRAEYRIPTETIATEMTRKWIKFKSTVDKKEKHEREEKEDEEEAASNESEKSDEAEPDDEDASQGEDKSPFGDPDEVKSGEEVEDPDDNPDDDVPEASKEEEPEDDEKTEKIKELEAEFVRLGVQDAFKKIAMDDGFFGRSHLFLDFSDSEKEVDALSGEMKFDIGDGQNETSREKVGRGSLKRLKVIEPVWTYPTTYNAINPLQDDWYKPTVWYVMGREIHESRLLTFVGRPVPDLLKPSYMFGGLSLSQLVKPYVDLWLDTRQNVGQLIQAFSVMVLQTNLTASLQVGGEQMMERAALFNLARDNAGLMMLDKNTEDFKNVSAPLSGLDHLQAQAQEHMMSVVRIPAVKFTGIQPTGLNASSEGEIRTFYDTIAAYQESVFRPNLTKVMHFVMLSLWGAIDEDITFDFEPLWALTRKEEAEVRKIEAETADILINGCAALRPEEVREAIAADPDTPYSNIDVEDVPDPPQLQEEGLAEPGKVNLKGNTGFGGGAGSAKPGGGGDDADPFARDDWNESDHPRAPDGRFGTKSGEHVGEKTEGGGEGESGEKEFKSKKEHAAHLLSKGTTVPEMLAALGWPSISMPQLARSLNMKLEKIKEGGVTKYKGTPMTKEESVRSLLTDPVVATTDYRAALVKAIADEKAAGRDAVVKVLQNNLIESWQKTHANLVKKGQTEKANEVAKKLTKLGIAVEEPAPPPPPPPKPEPGEAPKSGEIKIILEPQELKRLSPEDKERMQAYAARVQKVMDQVPEAARAMVNNVPIYVHQRAKSSGGRRSRYAGQYRWVGNISMVFLYGKGSYAWNEANVLTHEIAHAIDHKYDWELGQKVASYVDADARNNMDPSERKRARYWFKNNKERFAELYSLAIAPKNPEKTKRQYAGINRPPGTPMFETVPVPEAEPTFFGGMSRERAQKVFAKSLEYVRSLDIGNPDGPAGPFRDKADPTLYKAPSHKFYWEKQ